MGTRRVTLITCVVASTISSGPEKTATELPGERLIMLAKWVSVRQKH
jgi:hypothetical protein